MKTTIASADLGYYVAFRFNSAKNAKSSRAKNARIKPDAVIVHIGREADLELVISALKRLTAIMKARQPPKSKTFEI